MAISTYTHVDTHRPNLLGVAQNVDCTTTADQIIKLNTAGKNWFLGDGNSGNNTEIYWRNSAGTSLSTVTNAQIWTGTSRSGTQITNAQSLTGTGYASSSSVVVTTHLKFLTVSQLYFSCTATTAGVGAKMDIYIYGLRMPF